MKIHIDIDCFFVSAERIRYPFLEHKPVVIAKSSDQHIFNTSTKQAIISESQGCFSSTVGFYTAHSLMDIRAWREQFKDKQTGRFFGIAITKSYEAKALGITTGMPLGEALGLCPNLIIIPSDHLYYQHISFKLKHWLERKIPLLEQYSIDEFFGDLSGWVKDEEVPAFIERLKNDIKKEFGLPVSIGAAVSKWTAKVVTDAVKPFGTLMLWPEEVSAFIDPLSIEDFPGIGRAIARGLKERQMKTLGDIKRIPKFFERYGKTGRVLYLRICGVDNEPVHGFSVRKAIGMSRNFQAVQCRDELERRVRVLSRYLAYMIVKQDVMPSTYHLKLKYSIGYRSAKSFTCNRLFTEAFFIERMVALFYELDVYRHEPIHFLSMSASNFIKKGDKRVFSLVEFDKDMKMKKLETHINKVREKYGIDALWYGRERLLHVK